MQRLEVKVALVLPRHIHQRRRARCRGARQIGRTSETIDSSPPPTPPRRTSEEAPQARIVNFRAGHLLFGVLDTDTPGDTVFFARGYTLTAIASSRVDGRDRRGQEPPRFAGLDDALDHILTELDPAPTA